MHVLWSLDGVERIHPIYWSPDPEDDPIEFPSCLRLTRFQWQRDPDIHAVTEYANEAWVPWVWVGAMTKLAKVYEKQSRGLKEISGRSRLQNRAHCPMACIQSRATSAVPPSIRVCPRSGSAVVGAGGRRWRSGHPACGRRRRCRGCRSRCRPVRLRRMSGPVAPA